METKQKEILSGTTKTIDLVTSFACELHKIDNKEKYKKLIIDSALWVIRDYDKNNKNELHEEEGFCLVEDLVDAINDLIEDDTMYFGLLNDTYQENDACYGYWSS